MESFPTDSRVHRELSAIYAIEEDHDGLLGVMEKELSLLRLTSVQALRSWRVSIARLVNCSMPPPIASTKW